MKSSELTLKRKKRLFFTEDINYLAHTTRPRSLEVVTKTTDAVRGFRPQQNISELRLLLGLFNLYRRFVPNFMRTSAPLNVKLKNSEPNSSHLDESELAVMELLKE